MSDTMDSTELVPPGRAKALIGLHVEEAHEKLLKAAHGADDAGFTYLHHILLLALTNVDDARRSLASHNEDTVPDAELTRLSGLFGGGE